MKLKIILLLNIIISGIAQNSISLYVSNYVKYHNKLAKSQFEKLKVIEINNKYRWAKLEVGSGEYKYIFFWNIKSKDYLIEVECICPNICEPPDLIAYEIGKYSTPVNVLNFSLAKKNAEQKLKNIDYKLYFIPALYSHSVYVIAYTGNTSSISEDIGDDTFSESNTDILQNCVYNKQKFTPPDGMDITFVGYYSTSGGKLIFHSAQ